MRWAAQVQVVAPAEPAATTNELLKTVWRQLLDKGWGVGVGFTELPLHTGRRPVTAHASAAERVGLVSVPALGALGRGRRLRQPVHHLIQGLIGEFSDEAGQERDHAGRQICVALVVVHGLWERAPSPQARERVVLFNLATVATLALSVIAAYGLLFVIYRLGAAPDRGRRRR